MCEQDGQIPVPKLESKAVPVYLHPSIQCKLIFKSSEHRWHSVNDGTQH